MNTLAHPHKRHRFPPDVIQYAVWLYYRFNLSHRDIEDMLTQRRIEVSRESIHDTSQYANNRAELSHQPTRVRERGTRCSKSRRQAQRFLDVHAAGYNLFNLGRHLIAARHYRELRQRALASWAQAVAV